MEDKNLFTKPLKSLKYKILLILLISIALILVITSVVLWKILVFNDDVSTLSKFRFLTIVGDSMYPQFKTGDIIFVKKVPIVELQSGDIVVFKKDSILVTHRINKIDKEVFYTQGDNNITEDNFTVQSENVLGKFIFKIPKGEMILQFIKNPLFTIFIFLLLLINISLLFQFF